MASSIAAGSSDRLSTTTAKNLNAAKNTNWTVTDVITGPPSAGYTDLFVYQPNPHPGRPTLNGFADWAEKLKYYHDNYFELPAQFQPISGVSGLIIAARRACTNGRKLRQLRIMGHGSTEHVSIGHEQIWLDKLVDANGNQTALGLELEQLKTWLDAVASIVILDHCLCGQAEEFLKYLSTSWGGVAVRGYRDYQVWEEGDTQIGSGVFTQCAGGSCHYGVERLRRSKAH